MAASFAYLLLPVSGAIAYLMSRNARTRFHGLQAIAYGTLWPLLLYGGSAVSPGATQLVFGLGAVIWLALMVGAALGKNPAFPLLGPVLKRVAEAPPGAD